MPQRMCILINYLGWRGKSDPHKCRTNVNGVRSKKVENYYFH